MKLTKDKIDNGTREERVYACAKSFKLFCIFYFTKLQLPACPFPRRFLV
jgi:hypothetical protein